MDLLTHNRTKAILLKDFKNSGKDLGQFAYEWMSVYDDVCYELRLIECTSKGKPVTGTAVLGSCEAVEEFLENYEISGTYTVNLIDTQKEFFMILEEIKRDIEHDTKDYSAALKKILW